MADQFIELSDTAVEETADFGGFLRAAGKLAVAKQVSSLCLVGAVFVLPALTSGPTATDFVWSYFAMLTITSLLGLGLERLAATMSGQRSGRSVAAAVAPVLAVRVATIPLSAIGIWAVFAFVGVDMSLGACVATFAWIAAGLLGPVVFGALRAAGDVNTEPVVMLIVRGVQAGLLVGLAVAGASAVALVALVAAVEAGGVLAAESRLGSWHDIASSAGAWRSLPLRRAFGLAGIDIVGLANLRADLLLVGRILGAVPGATYGLLYRAVDGFNGVVGAVGLWLYAESANERDGGTDPRGLRSRSLALLPRLAILPGLLVALAAGQVGTLVPRLAADIDTLRILAVAFPILAVNAVELHVRSGRGRNREVLAVSTTVLLVNVPMSIGLIVAFGLPGAAAALALSEGLQICLLWCSASRSERALVGPALVTALVGALLVGAVAAATAAGLVPVALVGAAGVAGAVVWGLRRPKSARVVTA